jgi:hypothetical protein
MSAFGGVDNSAWNFLIANGRDCRFVAEVDLGGGSLGGRVCDLNMT